MLNYFYAHFAVKVITINRDLHTKCCQAFAAGGEEGRGGGPPLTELTIFCLRRSEQPKIQTPTPQPLFFLRKRPPPQFTPSLSPAAPDGKKNKD